MTKDEVLHLYDLLMTNFAVGQCVPLSALAAFLRIHDVTPAQYGHEKFLALFQEASDICTLSSHEPRPGVPLIWHATLLPRPAADEADAGSLTPGPDETREPERPQETDPARETGRPLPDKLISDQVFFPPNLKGVLAEYITGQANAWATEEMLDQVGADYMAACEGGILFHDETRGAYTFPLAAPASNGTKLIASICPSIRSMGSPWIMKYIGPDFEGLFSPVSPRGGKPGDALRGFAYLGNLTVFLHSLAEHVQEEPWSFSGDPDDYTILMKYINYTFYRLQKQDKVCIADDGSFAAFNTGLQSRRLEEDVFAYFVPNDPEQDIPWKFSCFCSTDSNDPGERYCYKTMFNAFKDPEPATYFSKISDLLFDPVCSVRLSSEHIFKDNCERLPVEFLRRECSWNPETQALLDRIETCEPSQRSRLFRELGGVITEDPDLFSSMHERLQGALARAVKRVRRNYKLAVPCFFPTRDVMSMMLPLSFTATGAPALVLVCERTLSGDYLGHTILTLPMAYIDARHLCRPGSEWLNTNVIRTPEVGELDSIDE